MCVGVTAGDIIAKLQKKSRLNTDLIWKRFCSKFAQGGGEMNMHAESLDSIRPPDDVLSAGKQFLFEVGGNIGNGVSVRERECVCVVVVLETHI